MISFLDFSQKLDKFNAFDIECEDQIASYYNIRQELDALGIQFRTYLTKSEYLIPFLQPGRLLKVSYSSIKMSFNIGIFGTKIISILARFFPSKNKLKTLAFSTKFSLNNLRYIIDDL